MLKLLVMIALMSGIITIVSLLNTEIYSILAYCYFAFGAVSTLAIATASLLVANEVELGRAFAFLTLQAICLVLTASAIYSGYGFIKPDHLPSAPSDGLYFSIVTWTTLGYGDFQPKPELRLMAATRAVFGYLFLGLIVGSVSSLLGKSNGGRRIHDHKGPDGTENRPNDSN